MSKFNHLLQRYLDHTATAEEKAQLMALLHSGLYEDDVKNSIEEELKAELRDPSLPGVEAPARSEEILKKILASRKPVEEQNLWVDRDLHTSTHRINYRPILRYAASLLLLAVAGVLLMPYFTSKKNTSFEDVPTDNMVMFANAGTTIRKVTLYDGSVVSLEPGSELRYPLKFDSKREVYLSGEAFFEVAKDATRPFLVYTNEVTTKVLGTSFRVTAHQEDKEIVVAVKTGKVSVVAPSGDQNFFRKNFEEVTLTPNQQAVYTRSQHLVMKTIVKDPQMLTSQPVLKNNYTNASVVRILKALSESYGVDIRYDQEALSNCTLTSDITNEDGLYEQLEIVCNALNGQYKIDNATIVIEASGCQ